MICGSQIAALYVFMAGLLLKLQLVSPCVRATIVLIVPKFKLLLLIDST